MHNNNKNDNNVGYFRGLDFLTYKKGFIQWSSVMVYQVLPICPALCLFIEGDQMRQNLCSDFNITEMQF